MEATYTATHYTTCSPFVMAEGLNESQQTTRDLEAALKSMEDHQN